MRLFCGLDLPPQIVHSLEHLITQLRPSARIHWSPPANLHITTRFIGEWPEARLPELSAALGGMPRQAPIEIAVRQLGFFPNPHAPRIFWAGVQAGPELAQLASDTDRALEPSGLPPEGRPFRPHLTLARIKERAPIGSLREAIAALPKQEFGSFTADRFFLYLSRPGGGGSVYSKLAEFPLGS